MEKLRTRIPVAAIEQDCYDWQTRHQRKCRDAASGRFDIVLLGDSLTHFWNGEDGNCFGADSYAELFGAYRTLNLGFGFDRVQNMLWRIDHGELAGQPPQLLVLNAGTNQFSVTPNYDGDTPEAAFEGWKLLLETLMEMLPDTRIVVMALFPRLPEQPTGRAVDELNARIAAYCAGHVSDRLELLDLGPRLRHADGSFAPELYVDGVCHLNAAGYRIWAEALRPLLPPPRR